eukprot:TRINITY_DN12519_c0_g2_i2.p1 TRINITY_DN12519_c0_g2~~TRINITY_DN12519_c0_g2_i2.p1  ORF type:complete len:220 (+),score=-20.20 TRINITY_DN12519_c0_g2_i2:537-1196(+)
MHKNRSSHERTSITTHTHKQKKLLSNQLNLQIIHIVNFHIMQIVYIIFRELCISSIKYTSQKFVLQQFVSQHYFHLCYNNHLESSNWYHIVPTLFKLHNQSQKIMCICQSPVQQNFHTITNIKLLLIQQQYSFKQASMGVLQLVQIACYVQRPKSTESILKLQFRTALYAYLYIRGPRKDGSNGGSLKIGQATLNVENNTGKRKRMGVDKREKGGVKLK